MEDVNGIGQLLSQRDLEECKQKNVTHTRTQSAETVILTVSP
ncbi:hypothetical protein BVRB_7g173290 [Beta vulgaris subsp. vulgaris]|nr:hypothetical protein BVRB_7g173290 [Beta vulgaris subsp. vulgaris]